VSEVGTTTSSLVSADELAGSCSVTGGDNQSVDTGYVSYSTRSLYVYTTQRAVSVAWFLSVIKYHWPESSVSTAPAPGPGHSCIIVSTVGWTWWDRSPILRTYLPSVLWYCWL